MSLLGRSTATLRTLGPSVPNRPVTVHSLRPAASKTLARGTQQLPRRTASSTFTCSSAAEPPSPSPNIIQETKAGVVETYRKLVDSGMDPDAAQLLISTSVQLVTEPLSEIRAEIRASFKEFKSDVDTSFKEFKSDVDTSFKEFKGDVDTSFKELKGELEEFKGDVDTSFKEVKAQAAMQAMKLNFFIAFVVLTAWSFEEFRTLVLEVVPGAIFTKVLGG